jgi:hypothetical protein
MLALLWSCAAIVMEEARLRRIQRARCKECQPFPVAEQLSSTHRPSSSCTDCPDRIKGTSSIGVFWIHHRRWSKPDISQTARELHSVYSRRRGLDRLARACIETNEKPQREGRERQDQDEYQWYLKLAARRLLIVGPNERRIRRMIEMVGDRHQKLPLSRVRAPADDMALSSTISVGAGLAERKTCDFASIVFSREKGVAWKTPNRWDFPVEATASTERRVPFPRYGSSGPRKRAVKSFSRRLATVKSFQNTYRPEGALFALASNSAALALSFSRTSTRLRGMRQSPIASMLC